VASLSRTLPQKIRAVRRPYLSAPARPRPSAGPCRAVPAPHATKNALATEVPVRPCSSCSCWENVSIGDGSDGDSDRACSTISGCARRVGDWGRPRPAPPTTPTESFLLPPTAPTSDSFFARVTAQTKEGANRDEAKRFRTREISVLAMANEDEQIPEFFIWGTGRSFTALLGS
jgi:hypothetical protein